MRYFSAMQATPHPSINSDSLMINKWPWPSPALVLFLPFNRDSFGIREAIICYIIYCLERMTPGRCR